MSEPPAERLYNLLPALYRRRDRAQGEPLRALLLVLEEQLQALEDDIAGLYENWFVETCAEWVVPYIGDLLRVRGLDSAAAARGFSQRAYVANTLAYRRRKGTAAILEQLARDTTAWPARAVEFFELLAATQHINHVRPGKGGTVSLHDAGRLELLGSPFESAAYTAEVRHIDNRRGKYNIPHVGLFLWRLGAYPLTQVTARAVGGPPGRYTFSPLGISAPLFNVPRTEAEITQLATEENVPAPLRRRPLHDELEVWRQALVDGRTPRAVYFDPERPVLQVFVQQTPGDTLDAIPSEELLICDLSDPLPPAPPPPDWRRPPPSKAYVPSGGGPAVARPIRVAVDPVTGRLAFPAGAAPARVEVSYAYGFPGDLGGGPYDRRSSVEAALTRAVTWQLGVMHDAPAGQDQIVTTLSEAVRRWNEQPPGTAGVITLMDSRTYAESLTGAGPPSTIVRIPQGSLLLIVAAGWPAEEPPEGFGPPVRRPGRLVPAGLRPHLLGDIAVEGTAPPQAPDPGTLMLDGLLIEGRLTVRAGNLGGLRAGHCTLVPGAGGLAVESGSGPGQQNERLVLTLDRTISGPLTIAGTVRALQLRESIVDGSGALAIDAPAVAVQRSTVLGESRMRELDASNSIFTGTVRVARRQSGCVRFCYLPPGSLAPRRYRCQPASEAAAFRVRPQFTSVRYGQPGFCQLAPTCPPEISRGAEDEGEMGVYNFVQQEARLGLLRTALHEYLRVGLEAGIFFVT